MLIFSTIDSRFGAKKSRMPSFVKIILFVLIALLTCAAVVIFLGYLVFYWPLRKAERNYLCNYDGGIRLHNLNGRATDYSLPSLSGKPVGWTPFAIAKSTFVYWSWSDHAISVTRGVQSSTHWFSLPKNLGVYEWPVDRMTTDGRFVALDMSWANERHAVVLLDTRNGKWRKIPNAYMARIDGNGSGGIMELTNDGNVKLENLSNTKPGKQLTFLGKDIWKLDYDFRSKRIYYLRNNEIIPRLHVRSISRGGVEKTLWLPFGWDPLELFWQPESNELWVGACGLFSIPKTPIYTEKGRFIGDMDAGEFYLVEVNDDTKRLLSAHFRSVRKY